MRMIMPPPWPARVVARVGVALPLLAFGLIALVSCRGEPALRQETTLSLLDVPASVTTGGSTFDVEIRLEGVTNLGAYEWQLRFDPEVVQFVEAANGPFLGSSGRAVSCLGPMLPATSGLEPGNVRFGCVTLSPAPPGPDGGGLLSTVTLEPLAEGAPSIQFFCAGLANPLGEDIPITNVPPCVAAVAPTPYGTPPPTGTPVPSAKTISG